MKNEQVKEVTSKAFEQLVAAFNEGRTAFRGRFWLTSNVESNLGIRCPEPDASPAGEDYAVAGIESRVAYIETNMPLLR